MFFVMYLRSLKIKWYNRISNYFFNVGLCVNDQKFIKIFYHFKNYLNKFTLSRLNEMR